MESWVLKIYREDKPGESSFFMCMSHGLMIRTDYVKSAKKYKTLKGAIAAKSFIKRMGHLDIILIEQYDNEIEQEILKIKKELLSISTSINKLEKTLIKK
jgi:hypothetical protein